MLHESRSAIVWSFFSDCLDRDGNRPIRRAGIIRVERGDKESVMSGLAAYAPKIDQLEGLVSAAPGDAVWLAHHRVADLTVRLIILDDPRLPTDVVRRATRESRLLSGQKTHAALVQIVDVVELPGGIVGVCTEHHPLGSLGRIVAQSGGIDAHEVAFIGREAAMALAALHDHRIVHLRISPGAILLTNDRGVSLGSFGALGEVEHRLELVGSHLSWVAPEQSDTPSADVYALGATLMTALTGRAPGPRPSLAGVPAALRPIFYGALHPDPQQRPSAGLLAEQLSAVIDGRDPSTVIEPARRMAKNTTIADDIDVHHEMSSPRQKLSPRRWSARRASTPMDVAIIDLRDGAPKLTPGREIDLRTLPSVASPVRPQHSGATTSSVIHNRTANRAVELPSTQVSDFEVDAAAPLEESTRIRPMVKAAGLATALVAALVGAMVVSSAARNGGPAPLVETPVTTVAEIRQPATDGVAQIGALTADGVSDVPAIAPIVDPVTGLAIPIDPAPIGQPIVADPRPTVSAAPTDAGEAAPTTTASAATEPVDAAATPPLDPSATVPDGVVLPSIIMDPEVVAALTAQQQGDSGE
jgi:serine/threonine protein kinase